MGEMMHMVKALREMGAIEIIFNEEGKVIRVTFPPPTPLPFVNPFETPAIPGPPTPYLPAQPYTITVGDNTEAADAIQRAFMSRSNDELYRKK